MTRGAKTGYTTSLTSVTSPNSWTTDRADFDRISSEVFFSLHFSRARKNLCYQGTWVQIPARQSPILRCIRPLILLVNM